MNLLAFGDSITYGAGASTPANAYIAKFAAYTGATLDNRAAGGTCALEMAKAADLAIYQNPPAFGTCVMMAGVNDSQRYFTSAQQEYYRGFLLEAILRASCPARSHAQDLSGAGWVNQSVPYAKMISTNLPAQPPCEKTATVSGTAVYVHGQYIDWYQFTGMNLPATTVEVRIDGALQTGTFASNATGCYTSGGDGFYGPFAKRYGGLQAGAHTVSVKVTNPGFLYLNAISGSAQTTNVPVYVGTPTRQFQPGVDPAGATIAALRQIASDCVTQVAADGRSVYLATVDLVQADLGPDLIHPTDAGHTKIFNAFKAAWDANQSQPTYTDGIVKRRNSDNAIVYRDADGSHETVIG